VVRLARARGRHSAGIPAEPPAVQDEPPAVPGKPPAAPAEPPAVQDEIYRWS